MGDAIEHEGKNDVEPTDAVTDYLKRTYECVLEGQESDDLVNELKQHGQSENENYGRPEWQEYLEQSKGSSYTYVDPNDGSEYEWDAEKRAWFPKIDEDFLAKYQANYGFSENGDPNPGINAPAKMEAEMKDDGVLAKSVDKQGEAGKKRKAESEKAGWFNIDDHDPKGNTNAYVSGLPTSMTEEQFVDLMTKCGILMEDDDGNVKIKMYKDKDGVFKGDARCCYLKYESLVLACELLDGYEIDGKAIHVEQAVFEQKGDYNPSLKPKKKKQKKKKGKSQEKLLDWVDRPAKRSKFDRIVILKHMFNHKDFERDPSLINEVKEDLRSECQTYGDVKKVLIFDRNPDGVCSVLFHEPEFADKCIEALNGRYYAGRVISAETYDGVTNYQVQETEEEMSRRLLEWEKFIEDEEHVPLVMQEIRRKSESEDALEPSVEFAEEVTADCRDDVAVACRDEVAVASGT